MVRDLLFVFQGIQGTDIQYSSGEDAFTLRSNLVVSHSTRKIVNELCELGWLYKKVNDWIKLQQMANAEVGSLDASQVNQSLCFSVQAELNEYYRLLSILDTQRSTYSE